MPQAAPTSSILIGRSKCWPIQPMAFRTFGSGPLALAIWHSAHCIDAPDPAGLAALFTEGGELRRPSADAVQGRAAIEALYRSRPAERLTRHLVVSTLVELQAPDQARALSRVLRWVGDAGDPAGAQGRPRRGAPLLGTFADRLRCQPDGSWLIEHRDASFEFHG